MVLLNGPVQNAWFCLMDRYQNVCVWFMASKDWNSLLPTWEPQVTIARNCRFPEDGTLGSCTVPNLGTRGYHCKQLPVPTGWKSLSPTWEPEVTIASKCRFPEVGTLCRQRGNHRLPLQGTAGSQRLELLVPNLGTMGYHCKQLLK